MYNHTPENVQKNIS